LFSSAIFLGENIMNTLVAAGYMLQKAKYFTAAELGSELGVSARTASGYLYNIRTCQKYRKEITPLPHRKVKLIAISGWQNIDHLWISRRKYR
tara:strand:- start:229 stop:507 length:279 start_codon:yes stop_codon:yes gene_type:complete